MTDSPEELLQKAKAGDAEAQSELGRSLVSSGNRAEAEQWFRRAAQQGLPKAKHNLGVLALQDGNMAEAYAWFGDAAKDGWLNSTFALGMLCKEAGEIDNAMRLLDSAARQGHPESQDALGRIYFDRETDADDVIARQWSELAAAQGVAEAKARLGTIFHEGRGTPRDPARAAAYFLDAAHQGHQGAQWMIGAALHLGVGITADRIEAAHWLMRSAAQGNPVAQAYLGANAGLADLTEHEREEAQRRANQPCSSLKPPGLGALEQSSASVTFGRRTTTSRSAGFIAVVLLLYAGAYVAFRQSHAEVWDRDKQTDVIYPETYGRPLYYLWRPLSYLDTAMTGMRHHIGPHR